MDIKLVFPNEEDYIKVDNLLLELHNQHGRNYPNYYKTLDSFNSKEEYSNLISQKNTIIIVAKEADNVLGLIWAEAREKVANKYMKARKELWLEGIVVGDGYRNQGIGKVLLERLMEIYGDKVFDSLELMCWSKNDEALSLYKNYFEERAVIMTYSK